MSNDVYLKELDKVDECTVWEVDGNFIRNNIDREFTNFGQHYRFRFIPTFEFWIDKEHHPNELKFYIDHLMKEWHLMREGMDYDSALEISDRVEKAARLKDDFLTKVTEKVTTLFDIVPAETYVKKLGTFGDVEVCLVDGKIVRDLYFIDFTEGGHHFVYDFVPYNEVWIDDDLSKDEREFVLLHELHERYLMSQGMDYNHAHRSSSIIEYKCRRNPKLLDKYIQEEVEKNESISQVPVSIAS